MEHFGRKKLTPQIGKKWTVCNSASTLLSIDQTSRVVLVQYYHTKS